MDTVVVNSRVPWEPSGHPRPAPESDVLYWTSTKKAIHLSSIGGLLWATQVREPEWRENDDVE